MPGSYTGSLPNWLSPIDAQGDADFPNPNQPEGELSGTVRIKLPTVGADGRDRRVASGTLSILFPEDNHEAEPDGFYIQVIGSDDININESRRDDDMMTLDVVIEDNEAQKVTVGQGRSAGGSANPTALYEGVDTAFTITAVPPRDELPLTVELDMLDVAGVTVSAAEISLETASVTLNADRSGSVADNSEDVTVHLPASDKNRVDNYYQLQASVNVYSLQAGGFDDIAVYAHHMKVLDVHKLPVLTVSAASTTVMEGGDAVKLTLSVNRNPANTIAVDPETILYTQEELRITVSPNASSTASDSDYELSESTVTIPERKTGSFTQTMDITVEASPDEDIDMETLVLDFVVNGALVTANGPRPDDAPAYDAQVSLTIDDATEALVSVKADASDTIKAALGDPPMLSPGMSGELMGSDLFAYDANAVSVGYSTSVDGAAVTASASNGTVTVTGAAAGDAKVTITATATPNASSLVENNQTKANVAQLTFPVTVVLDALAVTVEAADMEIMEGGSTMITATANREVAASDDGVDISLEVVGDGTLDAMSINIPVGSMSGSAMVTATEDDDYEDEMVTVVASGDGINGSFQIAISVTDNDEAPPPPAATVTAKSPEAVQVVFDSAVATARTGADWVEGGAAAMVDMSELFDVAEGASPAYSGVSSDEMVVSATASGMMLTLMPMSEGMATITVTAVDSASGDSDSASGTVTVADLPLSVDVSAPAMVAEGGSVMITATANKMADADVMVLLTRDGASTAGADDYTVGELMIAMGEMTGTAMLMATDDYDVEGDESLTLSAMAGDMSAGMVMVTIEDNDVETTYALSADPMMVMEGGTSTITATASQMVRENTEVMVMRDAASTAGDDDYSLDPVMITIMMGETTGTATLTATDDYDVEGNESLTLNGTVDDMAAGMVMVTIEDDDAETTYMLSADPLMVMEGGEVTVTATASQMVRENTEVMVMRDAGSAAGADDYTVSVPLITIMMGETTGSLTLTATDDFDVEGDESLTLNGTVGDMAAGSVMITINDNDVVSAFTLSGPMDMNLVEGESYELTVTAAPAVQMETTIMIMRDRSMSDADDADYTVEPVVIMAGESMGTTMLMVTEDSMDDAGSGMPEMLVVFGMVDGMETNSLTFYTWDMAVPALPLIAQLLLAAFLAIGGYRRYLRR